jgi:hypothetical protein
MVAFGYDVLELSSYGMKLLDVGDTGDTARSSAPTGFSPSSEPPP